VTGTAVSSANHAAAGTTVGPSTATCAAGKTLIGGGAHVTFTGAERGALLDSYPSTPGVAGTWTVNGMVTIAGAGNDVLTVQAFAYCE
jgi:hypothetical protein